MKYRKKPVVIEAIQYFPDNLNIFKNIEDMGCDLVVDRRGVYIDTLEGSMQVSPGDFVIKGVNGEFYPCKPDIFEKTYDLAD